MKVEVGIGELHGVSNNLIYLRLVCQGQIHTLSYGYGTSSTDIFETILR